MAIWPGTLRGRGEGASTTFKSNRIVAAAVLSILGSLSVDSALADKSYNFNLPEQSLAESLRQIGHRATMNILFDAASVKTMRAPAIRGMMSAEEALKKVLAGTGLVVVEMHRNSVLVLAQESRRALSKSSWDGERIPLAAAEPLPAAELTLEEIIVTAQRREENLQSVPIAISSVSGEDAQLRGAVSMQTLSATVPNLYQAGSFWSHAYVRGVGSVSASPNNDPSVATYVDGVYNPSAYGMSGFFFNNVERLEVLKGPQGTLFGRNATGGVIQVITSDPEHEFGGNLRLGYGNYETIQASAYLTGGITDNLAANVAVNYEDQGEGWGYNPTYQRELFWHRNVAARSKWLYTPSDSTKVTMAFDYARFDSDGANNNLLPGSYAIDDVTTFSGKYTAVGEVNVNDNEQYGAAVKIDHDFGTLHGVSITSFCNVQGYWHTDNDNTPNRWVTVDDYSNGDYWTQELHLQNRGSGRVKWLVGAFFYGNEVANSQPRSGERVTPNEYRNVFGTQDSRSVSGFGQATAEIAADTNLTLGVRYTDETLELNGRREDVDGNVYSGPFYDKISFDPFTWRVALDHQFTPDVLGYVSYNRGFKSGGFNLTNPSSIPFYPETVDAYEVGLKSEFMDHRVRLNIAAFYYDYKDLQVAIVPGGGGQIFTNAATARNTGLDAGLDFAATEKLMLSMGVSLLAAEYKNYPDARGWTPLGDPVPLANAKGQSLPYAPPFSGYVSANYRVPTSRGEFKGNVSLTYNDRSFISPTETPERPSYELLNASVEWWSRSPEPFGIRLWGRNLTDSYYAVNLISSSGGWYGTYAAPRKYGLLLMKNF